MSIKGKKVIKVIKANNPTLTSIITLQDVPIVTMQSVDTKDKDAKKNETSQDDNSDPVTSAICLKVQKKTENKRITVNIYLLVRMGLNFG